LESSLQVIAQFATLIAQMQDILARVPAVMSTVSTASNNFDLFLRIFQNSAIAAIAIMVLLVPLLWVSIFENWRSRIMEMRQGRSATLQLVPSCLVLIRSFADTPSIDPQ